MTPTLPLHKATYRASDDAEKLRHMREDHDFPVRADAVIPTATLIDWHEHSFGPEQDHEEAAK